VPVSVSHWGPSTYGQPCHACAFDWDLPLEDAAPTMSALATSYADLLRGATGGEQHPDLSWSSAAYVSHVGDNLRIWTERLRGVALGAPRRVGSYDESELARARNYDAIPLQAALWSLQLSVSEWLKAVDDTPGSGTVLLHPERGAMDLRDVVVANIHDARHHLWDIERTLRWGT
jgi:hypothetical protein